MRVVIGPGYRHTVIPDQVKSGCFKQPLPLTLFSMPCDDKRIITTNKVLSCKFKKFIQIPFTRNNHDFISLKILKYSVFWHFLNQKKQKPLKNMCFLLKM